MSRSNSIVKQASILALAGILVRIIGLLYRSPLTAMILDEGNGYYSTAYNIYALVLLISSYSIPTAISKLISEKIALKEYKNVHRPVRVHLVDAASGTYILQNNLDFTNLKEEVYLTYEILQTVWTVASGVNQEILSC